MLVIMLIVSFVIFLIIGVPIAFVLGLTPVIAFIYKGDVPLVIVAQRIFTAIDNPVLMAVPFFILAGNIMGASGLTHRLINFCKIIVGPIRGGLAQINVIISMIFAGITGAAVADTSAVGSILIPAMKKNGYDAEFACAVTATSSTIGPIIPPSIVFIVYGVLGEVSIASLFLAGFIPGVLLGFSQMGVVAYYSVKRGYPKGNMPSLREALKAIGDAFLVIMMPVIIIGGILTGVFTPTESACVAVFYAMFVSFFIYKDLRLRELPKLIIDAGVMSSLVLIVIGTANIFSWLLASEQIPQYITEILLSITTNKFLILILVNILLLIIGTFLETTASLIILTPVLLPVMKQIGIDPLHFGVFMVLNLVIGLTTPPVGVCLYIACAIGKITLEKLTKAILPFIVASLIVLIIVTYWPGLVLFIPELFGYIPLNK